MAKYVVRSSIWDVDYVFFARTKARNRVVHEMQRKGIKITERNVQAAIKKAMRKIS